MPTSHRAAPTSAATLAGGAENVFAPDADAEGVAALKQDVRLRRAVTLDQVGVPLDELLSALSDTSVRLTADAACAPLKLQVRLRDRPLVSLLAALAELVPGRWAPRADGSGRVTGYELVMGSKAREYRQRWWDLFLGERRRALEAQRLYTLAAMQTGPWTPDPRMGEFERGSPALRSRRNAVLRVFNLVPLPLQLQIAAALDETALDRLDAPVSTDDAAGGVAVRASDLPPDAWRLLNEWCAPPADRTVSSDHPSGGDHPPSLDPSSTLVFKNLGGTISARLLTPDGNALGEPLDLAVGLAPGATALPLDQSALPAVVARLGERAPQAWRELADCQRSRVWADPLAPAVRTEAGKPRPYLAGRPPRRADWLRWLGRAAHLEYVADYYSTPCTPLGDYERRPLTRPLKAELDAQASALDVSWRTTGDGLYLVRDNRWYRDDQLEVPAPLLRRWLAALRPAPLGGGSALRKRLDLEAEIASTLAPWQIARGLTWAFDDALGAPAAASAGDAAGEGRTVPAPRSAPGLPEAVAAVSVKARPATPLSAVAQRVGAELNVLTFYAGLSDRERAALLSGSLPWTGLDPGLQRQAAFLAPLLQTRPAIEDPGAPVRLGLGLAKRPFLLVDGDPGQVDLTPPLRLSVNGRS